MTGLTEKDAGTRWCPFSRTALYAGTGGATANRHVSDDNREPGDRAIFDETRCIGSRCMAWRWTQHEPSAPKAITRSWPLWIETSTFAEAKARPEPQRPDDLPEEDWEAVPLTGSDWEDAGGGAWRERPEAVEARYQLRRDKRCGRCGLAGKVRQ